MVSIEVTLELQPMYIFGLPEAGRTVIPATEEGGTQFVSKVIDTRTGQVAAHGTLSRYRVESEKVDTKVVVGTTSLTLRDNFLIATITADDGDSGLQALRAAVDGFLGNASLNMRLAVLGKIQGVLVDGKLQPRPETLAELANVSLYNTRRVQSAFEAAAKAAALSDQRLDKAVEYYSSALQVKQAIAHIARPTIATSRALLLTEFLSLWKAICTVVGDPSVRADRFQSTYRKYGISDDTKEAIDQLKRVRDNADVAHYSLDSEAVVAVSEHISTARTVAAGVVGAYRDHLLTQQDAAGTQP